MGIPIRLNTCLSRLHFLFSASLLYLMIVKQYIQPTINLHVIISLNVRTAFQETGTGNWLKSVKREMLYLDLSQNLISNIQKHKFHKVLKYTDRYSFQNIYLTSKVWKHLLLLEFFCLSKDAALKQKHILMCLPSSIS